MDFDVCLRKYSVRKRNISAPVSSKISSKAGSAPLKRACVGTAALSSVQLYFSCLRTLSNHLRLGHFWELSQNIWKRDGFQLKPAGFKE